MFTEIHMLIKSDIKECYIMTFLYISANSKSAKMSTFLRFNRIIVLRYFLNSTSIIVMPQIIV